LIGFPTRFLPPKQQTEPTLMVSRDGVKFHRYVEPVIRTSAPADRDGNRSNYMAWGLLKLPGDKEWSVYAKEAYYTGSGSRLRRFTYRPDGLVALRADSTGGQMTTRPVRFEGKRLVVNYRTTEGGSLRVGLLNAADEPLAGFSADDCQPLVGDELQAVVAWKSSRDVGKLTGTAARLCFVLRDAEVFSFRFE
jgi:hypothetical protein